jgi:6-pyruvoyltetrahydropterin/6-carboxytetrahydropterin synthase
MEWVLGEIAISRRFEWDSAHRIAGHEGACKALHGHRYAAEVRVTAPETDALGRIVDFGVLKSTIGDWIQDRLDHTSIFDRADTDAGVLAVIELNGRMGKPAYLLDGPPTAERIARELAEVMAPPLKALGIQLQSVKLWETPNCWALWTI